MGDGEGLAAPGDGVAVEPLGVAVGDVGDGDVGDGDVVGEGDCNPGEAGGRANKGGVLGEGVADKEGIEEDGFWPGTLSDRPLVVNWGDKSGITGRAAGVAGGNVAGGGGGITKGDCCGNRLVVRDRKDENGGRGGTEGTKNGGSVEDGSRPKP